MRPAIRFAVVVFLSAIVVNGLATDSFSQAKSSAQLYFFTNAACGPCRQVEPELEQLYREGYSVMKIDTSIHPDWTQRFQVTRTPTVVLVADGKVVGRRCGFVDAATLRDWFRRIKTPNQLAETREPADVGNRAIAKTISNSRLNTDPRNLPATRTRGTRTPANEVEKLAMQATVRFKVDDPQGSSYATGTVIHYHSGEALVLTCGHVFRESKGKGTISAEYGFADGRISRTDGELLFYDSEERDIGLLAISTDREIQPVNVARSTYPIEKGDQIFSIGCDHGESPTIRRSRVKNQARYDGVNKYEIYGRPVSGRSGGGMFTAGGQLVGVCNAAVVDADEGVYVALDTIHWQFKQANLAHLFDHAAGSANKTREPVVEALTAVGPRPRSAASRLSDVPVRQNLTDPFPRSTTTGNEVDATNVVHPVTSDSETELILVLRNKDSQGTTQSWTVDNPSTALIQQLQDMGQNTQRMPENRMARLRKIMPDLQNAGGKVYRPSQIRAQSPR